MKPLRDMNNVEKAKLLFELFPSEIKQFIAFTETTAKYIVSESQKVKDDWHKNNIPITANSWIEMARVAKEKIETSFIDLATDSNIFSQQLFRGYLYLFVIDCLQKYISICPNRSFVLAIEIIFEV